GGIITTPNDHMHVQLANHITQGRDIQFIGDETVLEGFGQIRRFLPELLLIGFIKLKQLADISAPGYEDEPRVVGILAQQQAAQWKVPQDQGVLLKTRIENKHGYNLLIMHKARRHRAGPLPEGYSCSPPQGHRQT